jgi:citrate synthase
MAALRTAVSAEGTLDPDAEDNSAEANLRKAKRLVARFPTIVAAYHRLREGAEPVAPDPELDHSANFLYMISGEVPSRMASEAVDRTLLLYLDHGFNASTFACRVIAATLGDMHSAITGGIGALKGSLHGGANAKAMDMLLEIDEVPRVVPFVEEALEKKQKIMGFGHRVYRTEDPRATHLREMSRTLSQDLGDPKWYEISRLLEDELKGRKGLNPNVATTRGVCRREGPAVRPDRPAVTRAGDGGPEWRSRTAVWLEGEGAGRTARFLFVCAIVCETG